MRRICQAGVFRRSRRRLLFIIAPCVWYFFLSERWLGINITSSSKRFDITQTKRNKNEIDIPSQQVSAGLLGGDEIIGESKEAGIAMPIKIFGLGFKKTGTTSLDNMYSHLIDVLGGSRPRGGERSSATSDMIKGNETSTLMLAEKHNYFQDSPWCHEPNKLYQRLRREDGTAIAITEAQGMLWISPFLTPLEALAATSNGILPPPPRVPEIDMPDYKTQIAIRDFPIDWTVLMENIMDPDHGYFAHSSSF